ncbi:hypothetical protein DRJ17_05350 [Candidatus Woesearchaeota archaeon]|nr:MAG: hypothetical protein DRJ17_05350 [Candidatus Woesearchaeota archaeon]
MVKDKRHANVMADYIKYLGDYYLDAEAYYVHYKIERYADVVSFEYDDESDKIIIVLTEIKSYITDIGQTIRQVKASVKSFEKSNKELIHKLLGDAMVKLSKKTGKTFILSKDNYYVKGRLVLPLTKQTIQQIKKYRDLLKGIETFFLAKDKDKLILVNIKDDSWKKMQLYA